MDIRVVLDRICKIVSEQRPLTSDDFNIFKDAIIQCSDEDKLQLYSELCAIQIAADGVVEIRPIMFDGLLDWNDISVLKNFVNTVISNGHFVDIVADSIEMDPSMCKSKWNNQEFVNQRTIALHRRNSDILSAWSQFLFDSRERNLLAYNDVVSRLRDTKREWQQLLSLSPDELKNKDRFFWYGIQTKRLTIEEKRAVWYKLDACRSCSPEIINRRIPELTEEIFFAEHNSHSNYRRGRFIRKIVSRILRIISRVRRHRTNPV